MTKNYGFLVCLLIMALDITAGVLGIEAEIAENKVKHLKMWIFECRDPSLQAYKLGLAASVLLGLAHVVGNLLGGCVCIWTKEDLDKASANKQLAVCSLIFSWIILAVGFTMLIMGTLSNSKSRKSCGLSHHRLFSIGGILCFIHGLFTVAYYVSATAAAREDRSNRPRAATTTTTAA
ncbi:Desigual 2 [Hibiscus trionum]|uniref:Desigual 2 n=1 Tax=Hibiscus trionum TaxID=183268 RepID=A0A9W7HH10_HIBTR|nr:Desigual 2 [Hibiscus trionum]